MSNRIRNISNFCSLAYNNDLDVVKRTVLTRGWSFLEHDHHKKSTILPAGKHSWPFEATLPNNLPETIQGSSYGDIRYTLKAEAVRTFAKNLIARSGIEIRRRPNVSQQPVRVAGEYNHITYEMVSRQSIHKRNDRLLIDMYMMYRQDPATPVSSIQSITTIFKENISILPSTHDTRTLRFLRENGTSFSQRNHTVMDIRIPRFTQYDSNNNLFSIKHEVEFTLTMANKQECRVTLPIIIAHDELVPALSRNRDHDSYDQQEEWLPSYADALLPPMYMEHDLSPYSSPASSAASTPADEPEDWLPADASAIVDSNWLTASLMDPTCRFSRLPSYDTAMMAAPATTSAF